MFRFSELRPRKLTISLLVLAFLVWGGVGIYFLKTSTVKKQTQVGPTIAPQPKISPSPTPQSGSWQEGTFSSPIAPEWYVVSGEVKKIGSQEIEIEKNGKEVVYPLSLNLQIIKVLVEEDQEIDISLSEIKVGEMADLKLVGEKDNFYRVERIVVFR